VIQFRCWYCNRYFRQPSDAVHSRVACPCGHRIRVPKRDWRSSKPWSFTNWLAGAVVYGGGMGLLAFLFTFFFFGQNPVALVHPVGWAVLGFSTLVGVLIGVVGGERGSEAVVRFFQEHGLSLLRSGNPGGG
jgi:hypothetical protein